MAVQWILLGTASNISKNQISNKKILIKIGRPTIKIIYKSGHHLVYGVRNNVTNLIDFCILKGINEELLKQNHFSCVFIRPHPCALWNIHLRSIWLTTSVFDTLNLIPETVSLLVLFMYTFIIKVLYFCYCCC